MIVRTRFAPSPTGRIHLGHAFAAQVAYTLAQQSSGGRFLLRHEDIDAPRVRDSFYHGIEQDLQWLGLQWDETPLRQSKRASAYADALAQLQNQGLVYPCFCTRKEIQQELSGMSSAPHGFIHHSYPGTCRMLSRREQQAKLDSGTPHAWRIDSCLASSVAGALTFHSLRFGILPVDPNLLGDVVLARKDIGCAYHLAVVVDDAFQQITHVTRGDDLLPSTHVHRLLQALLGLPEPVYFHHPLMLDDSGKRLAKRCDSQSIAAMRDAGLTCDEVLAMMRLAMPQDLPFLS